VETAAGKNIIAPSRFAMRYAVMFLALIWSGPARAATADEFTAKRCLIQIDGRIHLRARECSGVRWLSIHGSLACIDDAALTESSRRTARVAACVRCDSDGKCRMRLEAL
jgi:hypothetical protein